ncbi:MAG TPA: zinc-dependent alcohol dehydrogenase family protein [Gammaproteobacteria bacterium]|nr:zinc-dependent alcohol dehydrogenase family protein [Gammaproteobacteria bacterium]
MDIPQTMRAMVLEAPGEPLVPRERPVPEPDKGQVLVRVEACGVCRTDLHIVDGELNKPRLPLIPGHEIVGRVVAAGDGAGRYEAGSRVGVPWLGHVDGTCRYCRRGQENLCDHPLFTGYTMDGGYAEYVVAFEDFCFPVPESYAAPQAAPLLCAGLIGYRAYRMTGEHVERLGLYGFGAAAHILAQVAVHEGKQIYAFTKPGDERSQEFARRLGAQWAGASGQAPPETLDAAIIFAPVGPLVVDALRVTDKGGSVVCGGIHMSDIPQFPYRLLWEERTVRSVANLTRRDGEELLAMAPRVPVATEVHTFPLAKANEALDQLRSGAFDGAAVLTMG